MGQEHCGGLSIPIGDDVEAGSIVVGVRGQETIPGRMLSLYVCSRVYVYA
jgi:hypothetical protein